MFIINKLSVLLINYTSKQVNDISQFMFLILTKIFIVYPGLYLFDNPRIILKLRSH